MEPKNENKGRKKKLIILISALVLVIIGMVVAIILVVSKPAEPEINPRSFEEMFWDSETSDEAIQKSNEQLEKIQNVEAKIQLLEDRYNFLDRLEKTEEYQKQKLKDALLIDELQPTYISANRLMIYYLEIDDIENYEKYLNLYYERAK